VRQHEDVPDEPHHRDAFEHAVHALVGLRLLDVVYGDVAALGPEPRVWDHRDWHHAVLGVELVTDAGTRAITWASTFGCYGVEVLDRLPLTTSAASTDGSPETWRVSQHPRWAGRLGAIMPPAAPVWGAPAGEHGLGDVPLALRVEIGDGPVWFVAATSGAPGDGADLGMDEVVVVFADDHAARLGLPAVGAGRSSSAAARKFGSAVAELARRLRPPGRPGSRRRT